LLVHLIVQMALSWTHNAHILSWMLSYWCPLPLSSLDDIIDLKSILGNILAPFSWSNKSSILGKGYLFFMVTLFNYLKSIHSLKVPSFLFTKGIGAPQSETLGCIYPFFNNSSSCICNSFNSNVPIMYGFLDIGEDPSTISIEKSISLFCVNPRIYLKTSSKSINIGWSPMLATLSLAASSIWIAQIWHHFLKLFFNCIAEIYLTTTKLGIPLILSFFHPSSRHVIVLLQQSRTWCFSNQSMPVRQSYELNGMMFTSTFVLSPFCLSDNLLPNH